METWILPLLLLAVGLGLALLDVFFPSAGVLTFGSIAILLGVVLLGFRAGNAVGVAILAVAVLGLPTVMMLGFRLWPHTTLGKMVLLEAPKVEDVLPDDPQRRKLKGLVGRLGKAKCQMLPGGVVAVDGQNVEAVSEGMAIESGQTVRVVKVEGARVVVRPVDEEIPTASAENPLERPIDSIVNDPFQEPLV